jgi:CHAT domain-containing protein/tetratricopeptide (TPR) repeat protein
MIGLLWAISVSPLRAQSPATGTFVAACQQPEQLSTESRQTLQVLLQVAETKDCQIAATTLANLTYLDLSNQQLTNLELLSNFPQIQRLQLENNSITEIIPLTALGNLSILFLDNNPIRDLSPIGTLTLLEILSANNTGIGSIDFVQSLPLLSSLSLEGNQIQGIGAIATLTTLNNLELGNNQIADITPLGNLVNLQGLDLSENLITQVNSLSVLKELVTLDLRNNPLRQKTCPIFPATKCLVSDAAAEEFRQAKEQFEAGQFQLALSIFQQTQQVYAENGDLVREANALDLIGNSYDGLGEYANALTAYQAALEIRQLTGDRAGETDSSTNLGITYIRIGQTERAFATLSEALALHRSLPNQDEPRAGRILSGLALAYSQAGEDGQALTFAKRSLASHRQGNDQPGEAVALVRVGVAYLNLGDPVKARVYLDRALELSTRMADASAIARSQQALGNWAWRTGDSNAAKTFFQAALSLREAIDDAAGQGETLNSLGELLYSKGDLPGAIATLTDALERWEALPAGLTDENKISIAELQGQTYRLLQVALIEQGDVATALTIAERGRSRAFAELLTHRLKLQGKLPIARALDTTIIQSSDIQRLAQTQNLTLVEYSQVQEDLFIWVIKPDGQIHFKRTELTGEPIATWVAQNREAMGVPFRAGGLVPQGTEPEILPVEVFNATLRSMYDNLIAPIAVWLPAESTAPVVIIPQGELFLVPFPALRDETGRAFIERHALAFAPAIKILLTPALPQSPLLVGRVPAMVVGNPNMPMDPSTSMPLPPLPYSQQEAFDVAALLNTEPLVGAAATTQVVVEGMAKSTIIHLATHGLLDDFGTGVPGALSFTPTPEDDGYLTAAEILELPLAAQLVVLSACDTGRGKITGDGVVGLSRSLLTAGVDSVVVSLWAVPDESTALLMKNFYEQLKVYTDPAVALQAAMLITRQDPRFSEPKFWAAFNLYTR